MPDALVQQQPLVEAAQTGELARNRARLDLVPVQMLQKPCNLTLLRRFEYGMRAFEILGEQSQIALVRLAAQRTQPFLYPQVEQVLANQRRVRSSRHGFIIGSVCRTCPCSEQREPT